MILIDLVNKIMVSKGHAHVILKFPLNDNNSSFKFLIL